MTRIKFTGRGIKLTTANKEYVNARLAKMKNFLARASYVDVEVTENKVHKGVSQDFKIEITVGMPNVIIRVEELGDDLYALIDKTEVVLRRRLQRFFDKQSSWEKRVAWKTVEAEELEAGITADISESDLDTNWANYKPKIVRRKEYSDNTPIYVAEAIERMELVGHPAFLFRNIESGKYAMVYKRRDGNYGLVEPKED